MVRIVWDRCPNNIVTKKLSPISNDVLQSFENMFRKSNNNILTVLQIYFNYVLININFLVSHFVSHKRVVEVVFQQHHIIHATVIDVCGTFQTRAATTVVFMICRPFSHIKAAPVPVAIMLPGCAGRVVRVSRHHVTISVVSLFTKILLQFFLNFLL